MFSTRLNPTKPPAAHRAILERVGAACRELRPIVEASFAADPPKERLDDVFKKHGVLTIGVPKHNGGAGTDPLLLTMAAERLGREGQLLARSFAEHIRDQGSYSTPPDGVDPAVEKVRTAERKASASFSVLLNYRLCIAGSCIGALADCLEAFVDPTVAWINANSVILGNEFVEEQFGWVGTNLEAARAITYAAAELKAELDQHPASEHLRLEAATLVNEAALAANQALKVSLSKAAKVSIGKESLIHRVPARHNYGDWGTELVALEKEIGRFYLFQ